MASPSPTQGIGKMTSNASPKRGIKGYAALSLYMNASPELGVVRKFGALHYRNLLYLQDSLLEIEEQLHSRDILEGEHGCRRRDNDVVRAGLMEQLRVKLQRYGM